MAINTESLRDNLKRYKELGITHTIAPPICLCVITLIIRLQATLRLMEQQQFTSLTSLAHENGYFDQVHFIKDFREFTGMSPGQFYGDHVKLSVLFIGTE